MDEKQTEDPFDPEIVARQIAGIKKAMTSMQRGLNRRAIVALIHDRSKIGKRQIEMVLNNLDALADNYLVKRKRKLPASGRLER